MVLLSLGLTSAINLDISADPVSNKVITDLDEPAVFDLTIRNLGETEEFEIYSLIGVDLTPSSKIIIPSGSTETITLIATPRSAIKSNKGFINFEYRIKDEENQIQKETLTINIVGLDEIFAINLEVLNPKAKSIKFSIENKANLDFDNVEIIMNSAFFDFKETISIKALETKQLEVNLDEERMKTITAGVYLLNTNVKVQGKTAKVESLIKFLEQEDIETTEINEGVLIQRNEILKKNLGNVKKLVEVTAEKNLFSYLFTTINIPTTKTSTEGFTRVYVWEKELIPDEELRVIIKTNWFFPIIVLLLIIGLFLLIKKSVETDLILRKKVTFVKTKGGQFALKISLRVKSKRFLQKINIIDKLPPLVKLYERFGATMPDKIDEQNKRLEWNIESLNEGEERIFTYIIYSKIGIVGRFELPSARAVYEKEGKVKKTESNRSFFINEPKN